MRKEVIKSITKTEIYCDDCGKKLNWVCNVRQQDVNYVVKI